jgi:hypothetical protein
MVVVTSTQLNHDNRCTSSAKRDPTPSWVGHRHREVGAEPVLTQEKRYRRIREEIFLTGATLRGGEMKAAAGVR